MVLGTENLKGTRPIEYSQGRLSMTELNILGAAWLATQFMKSPHVRPSKWRRAPARSKGGRQTLLQPSRHGREDASRGDTRLPGDRFPLRRARGSTSSTTSPPSTRAGSSPTTSASTKSLVAFVEVKRITTVSPPKHLRQVQSWPPKREGALAGSS